MSADAVITYVNTHVPHVLQIGGDETIGKGLCAVQLMDSTSAINDAKKGSAMTTQQQTPPASDLEQRRAKACLGGRKQRCCAS